MASVPNKEACLLIKLCRVAHRRLTLADVFISADETSWKRVSPAAACDALHMFADSSDSELQLDLVGSSRDAALIKIK